MKGKKIFLPIALLSLVFGVGMSTLTACGGGNGGQSSAQTQKITITAADNKKELILGDAVQLTASVDGVSWESDHPEIATVSESGLVQSLTVGTVKITAKKDGYKEGTITINVKLEKIAITAEGSATSIELGGSLKLTASKEGVAWSSSDETIATVDQTGKVTGIKFGTVTITAAKEGFDPGTISLNITRPAPKGVLSLDDADHYSPTGEWAGYNTTYETPVYAKEQASGGYCLAHFAEGYKETFTFTSDKAVKAEVTLVILARSSYENVGACFTAKFNGADVTTLDGVAYAGDENYPSMELSLGEFTLIAGNNVLEINFLGGSPYLDDIKVYADEALTLTTVIPPEKDPVVLKQEKLTIKEGETSQIESDMTGLSYKSNNTAIATVDENGLVTAVKVGSTTISVSKDGYKVTKLPVEVTEAEGVFSVSIEGIQGEGITTRTSYNLEAPTNYIIDEFPANAVGTLEFNVENAGTYDLYMRARASGGYNSSNVDDLATCMELSVNGVKLALTNQIQGSTFTDYLLGEVTLTAGKGTIEIKCLTTVPTINLFRFIPKA